MRAYWPTQKFHLVRCEFNSKLIWKWGPYTRWTRGLSRQIFLEAAELPGQFLPFRSHTYHLGKGVIKLPLRDRCRFSPIELELPENGGHILAIERDTALQIVR